MPLFQSLVSQFQVESINIGRCTVVDLPDVALLSMKINIHGTVRTT